nr:hypothetical protein CFP56_22477 [Quercus suber]
MLIFFAKGRLSAASQCLPSQNDRYADVRKLYILHLQQEVVGLDQFVEITEYTYLCKPYEHYGASGSYLKAPYATAPSLVTGTKIISGSSCVHSLEPKSRLAHNAPGTDSLVLMGDKWDCDQLRSKPSPVTDADIVNDGTMPYVEPG